MYLHAIYKASQFEIAVGIFQHKENGLHCITQDINGMPSYYIKATANITYSLKFAGISKRRINNNAMDSLAWFQFNFYLKILTWQRNDYQAMTT